MGENLLQKGVPQGLNPLRITMEKKNWTVMELIRCTADFFASKGIASPRLDAELLLAHLLEIERIQLYMYFDRPLNEQELDQYRQLVRRRAEREPIAYITGEKEFWSLKFKVTTQVLIPRPETEILLESTLSLCKNISHPLILDLGTGSGCLAITLAKELETAKIIASDSSSDALDIARENAKTHEVFERINWCHGNLFDCLGNIKGELDLLVSNPPYVTEEELAQLQPEVRFEPRQALAAGADGLDIYRKIVAKTGDWIKNSGYLCLEIGAAQATAVSKLLQDSNQFAHINIVKDYAGLDRVITAQRCG